MLNQVESYNSGGRGNVGEDGHMINGMNKLSVYNINVNNKKIKNIINKNTEE